MCLANIEVNISPSLADALPSADRLCDLGDRLTDPGERAVCYTAAAVLRHIATDDGWLGMDAVPADTPVLVYWPALEKEAFVATYDSSVRLWRFDGQHWLTSPIKWRHIPEVPTCWL